MQVKTAKTVVMEMATHEARWLYKQMKNRGHPRHAAPNDITDEAIYDEDMAQRFVDALEDANINE